MFHPPEAFPALKALVDATPAIRAEFQRLDRTILDIPRTSVHEEFARNMLGRPGVWTPNWQVDSPDGNYQWLTYWLYYLGQSPIDAASRVPQTVKLLRELPGCRVAAFLLLKPLSVIGAHVHSELGDGILTAHLGLDMAPGCSWLHVAGAFEEEAVGRLLVFDGSATHFALNASTTDRTILYVEFDARA